MSANARCDGLRLLPRQQLIHDQIAVSVAPVGKTPLDAIALDDFNVIVVTHAIVATVAKESVFAKVDVRACDVVQCIPTESTVAHLKRAIIRDGDDAGRAACVPLTATLRYNRGYGKKECGNLRRSIVVDRRTLQVCHATAIARCERRAGGSTVPREHAVRDSQGCV